MNTVLVALDNSPVAQTVLARAVDLARRNGSKLHLLRVVGLPVELPPVAYAVPPTDLPELLVREARRELEARAREVPPELLGEVLVEVGVPWEAICHVAKARDVDAIVLGAHGYRVIDRLIGTTAARVVNHADRDVLVVRPRPGATR